MEKYSKKFGFLSFAKIIMGILTAVYPLFMVGLSGAGLIYNRVSYGSQLATVGGLLIASGIIMTVGAVLCALRKNISAMVCSGGGLALCLSMLFKLCTHADSAGWSDKFNMTPISDMYKARILPCIAPVAIAVIVAAIQHFSREEVEKRRKRRRDAENAPAPKIIDD